MSDRNIRFVNVLKTEISTILRKHINDSRIGFVSITDIKLSPDFKYARILYSQIGSESEKKHTLKALNRAASFIKFEIGKIIKLRTIPTIKFEFDDSLEKGVVLVNKINNLQIQSDE